MKTEITPEIKVETSRLVGTTVCYPCGRSEGVKLVVVGRTGDAGNMSQAIAMCGSCRSELARALEES